jgi:glycosyltransferase involved in cell wall biosynthesis
MKILYLSYTGLAEPLGDSQVFAYLRGLSGAHCITLVSFEKPADLADAAAIAALRARCAEHGIRWIARRYHHRPRLAATAWDLAGFTWTALRQARQGRAEIVHARSYIPGFVALVLKRTLGLAFIFDMRAFWPEEMVTAGRLKRGSAMFRLLTWGERLCLRRADAVVSLTHAAVAHLKQHRGSDVAETRFAVIPTCVDLDRFGCRAAGESGADAPVIGSVGTVLSGWFKLDWLMGFLRASGARWPDATFRVITRDDPARIAAVAAQAGIDPGRLEVAPRAPGEMPQALVGLDAVAMFFEPAVSELARCPTRMGEVLAAGLPVVANDGVGDVAEIIRGYGVGVVVEAGTREAMDKAAVDLDRLLQDPDLPQRCRKAAEEWFSLEAGVAAYDRLYGEIAASSDAGAAKAKPRLQQFRRSN